MMFSYMKKARAGGPVQVKAVIYGLVANDRSVIFKVEVGHLK